MARTPTDTLFIGGLASEVTEAILHEICCQAGEITRINLKAAASGQYAFCQYKSVESAIYAWALLRDCVRLFGRSMNVDFSKSGDSELDETLQELWQKAQAVVVYNNDKVVQMATQSRNRNLQHNNQYNSGSTYGRAPAMVRQQSAASNGSWDSPYALQQRQGATEAAYRQYQYPYGTPPAYGAGAHYGAPAAATYGSHLPPHLQQQQQQQRQDGGYPVHQPVPNPAMQHYQAQQHAAGYANWGYNGGYPQA